MTEYIKANKLENGDQVQKDDGIIVTIKTKSNGMIRNHIHFELSDGTWSEIPYNSDVYYIPKIEDYENKF